MFSQALMYYASNHFENGCAGEPEIDTIETGTPEGVEMTPSKVLRLAYHDVLADETVEAGEIFLIHFWCGHSYVQGSCTACLLTLNTVSGMLQSAKYVRSLLELSEVNHCLALAIQGSVSFGRPLCFTIALHKHIILIVLGTILSKSLRDLLKFCTGS
jgi:hypothetical protein